MITLGQIKSFLTPFKGSTLSTNGHKGLVPAPTKNQVGEYYLNASGNWKLLEQGWSAFPVGFIYDNWTSNTLPANFLFLEGAEISRTTYSELYNFAVSYNMIVSKSVWTNNKAYGLFHDGDGSTTFGLPDWRGNFKRYVGGNAGTLGYQQAEGLPNISGNICTETSENGVVPSGAFYQSGTHRGAHNGQTTKPLIGMDASRSSSIYGASTHVTPINIATRAIIKYQM